MHILVVEDETMVARKLCRMIREILQERIQSLHQVDSLEDAESHLENHTIDLLFLDLNLSGEDGFDLLSTFVASNFKRLLYPETSTRPCVPMSMVSLISSRNPSRQPDYHRH